MKRLDRHTVRGPVYKHFDLERKNAKQAEARLNLNLQRLEVVCLYHVKLLTREQRLLQKELQRLQQVITKKKFSSYFGNGIQKGQEDVPGFPPQGRQKRVPQANNIRALAISKTQEINKANPHIPPAHHTGLKILRKGKEQPLSQNHRTPHLIEEKPQVQEEVAVDPSKGKEFNKDISTPCGDQEVPTNTLDQYPTSSPAAESRPVCVGEIRSEDTNPMPDLHSGRQMTLSPAECAGNCNGESTEPNYLELFMKVRNAHYIRHRVPPESERLLSIREIFGHQEPLEPRAEKEQENGVTP